MATITTTMVRLLPVVSFPLVQQEKSPEGCVRVLCDILEKYKEWKDPLSQKLFAWGVAVVSIDLEGTTQAELDQGVISLADELASKVLRNPLDNSPLEKPMLDRGLWVWEKAALDDYRSIAPKAHSPFDNKPFDVMPHHFALDVMEWTSSLPVDIALKGRVEKVESKRAAGASQDLVSRDNPQARELRHATYCLQALAFVINQVRDENIKLNETISEGTRKIEAFKASVAQLAQQEAQRAAAAAQDHLDRVEARITASEQTHSATVAVLNSSLQDTSSRLSQRTQELNTSLGQAEALKERVAVQERRIQALGSEVNNLRNAPRPRKKCVIM